MAFLCSQVRPNFLPDFLCLIFFLPLYPVLVLFVEVIDLKAKIKIEARQDPTNVLKRLSTEVLCLQHVVFSLLDKFADQMNPRAFQTVAGTNREFEILDALKEIRIDLASGRTLLLFHVSGSFIKV